MYGIGTIADSRVVMMGTQERSDHNEVERLKEKIAKLEQDKIEKHAMMEKIEQGARLYAKMNKKIQNVVAKLATKPATNLKCVEFYYIAFR
ncbi:hypothetical protein HanXRQr2_Chr09g0378591 [Helianthus annuus]|uniref:Uncharacterized protein n=1 Tax=Helianthus annuus TaxID=4232 RepID=A0A9K3I4E8_HELAN|nr:hypothetical protein HanXRQr2_Chr09g0378591 [Helianthus annuus]KAJ0892370.1 hypothetical protein HanPSC8_Chr09g0365031 [Helianthus annuus]